MSQPGSIYLVGTGPGEAGLITVKGLALLREADALVADTLAQARLLQEARPEAEVYDTGSHRRGNALPRAEVRQLLLELARAGKMVVRLWPGDPFVFGWAAQELAEALQAGGLPVELVPGVSSAIAGPAYAGVPVTHWEQTASFTVVSGYESEQISVRPDWAALAGVETLVILMGQDNLPHIIDRLLAAGRPADTPALAVQSATLPGQRQVSASLATLAERVDQEGLGHPLVVVVGPVAGLADQLDWYRHGETVPLRGQRVLVTRPTHQAGDFMASLRQLGAEPVSFPTIEIRAVEDLTSLDRAIRRLAQNQQRRRTGRPPYDWLVLTSVNGVAAVWERLAALGLDSRVLAGLQVAAIGPATAAALVQRSIRPDLVPEVYTAEGVLAAFEQRGVIRSQRFLLARADIARKTLAEGLVEGGGQVEEIAAYRTVPVAGDRPPPPADIVTFTSSSTVQGYVNCLAGRKPAEALRDSRVVCIGPITAKTAESLQVPVSAVAEEYTIDGLLAALRELAVPPG
jgi:uroporphyrinogen III methyltransferase/synthase